MRYAACERAGGLTLCYRGVSGMTERGLMNTPDLASLKASVEPSLKEGDFDALWKEFTETFPSTDPDDFLTWLHEKELLTTSVFKTLLGQGTLAPATSAEPPPPPPPPPPPVVKSVAPRHVKPTMSFTPEMIAEERGLSLIHI